MRLLRVLGFDRIFARRLRHIGVAEILADDASCAGDGLRRQVDAVRAHISDETDRLAVDVDALVKALGDLHGPRRREAELARRFLLQRRGGEGRGGVALGGLRLDVRDLERGLVQRRLEGLGLGSRADVEARDFLAVGADEPGDEGRAGRGLQMRDDRPIFARDEALDLELAVADEAQRDRLHAAGRTRAGQFAPQHGRQVEADEIVQRAAGEIGVDQRLVDFARMPHRVEHRRPW